MLLRPAQGPREANNGDDDDTQEHPNGLISRRSGKEPGNVGAERVCGVDANDHEHHAANEQCQRNDFIHNEFSIDGLIVFKVEPRLGFSPHKALRPEMTRSKTMTIAITRRR